MNNFEFSRDPKTIVLADERAVPMSCRMTHAKAGLLLNLLDRRMNWCDDRLNDVDDTGNFVMTNVDRSTNSELSIVSNGETLEHIGMTYTPGNASIGLSEPEEHRQLFDSHS